MVLDPNMGGDQKRPDSMFEELLQALEEQVAVSRNQSGDLRAVLGKLDNCTLSFEEPQSDGDCPMSAPSSHVELFKNLITNLAEVTSRNGEMINHFRKII